MKEPEDLDDNPASVGGAMSQWPLQTIAWTCRTERSERTDPHVVDALLERDVHRLGGLIKKAERVDIGTDLLQEKRDRLRAAHPKDIRNAIVAEYRQEYPGEQVKCPNEESGLDKSCWSCPVPGRVMRRLE